MEYTFSSELWIWPGDGAWYFVTLPKDISTEIKLITAGNTKGFGSVKVIVTSQDTSWNTSIFPDSKSGCFMLPVKKDIRKKLAVDAGSVLEITLQIVQ
jgi:hypothetical protein